MNLREALEAHEADYNLKMVADHHVAVVAAARRFLALTEVTIWWCKTHDASADQHAQRCHRWLAVPLQLPPLPGDCAIVDAALADYLTED